MTNNISDNKNSQATTTRSSLSVLNSVPDDNNTSNNNQTIFRNNCVIPKYANDTWYQEIIGSRDNLLSQQQQQPQQKRQIFYNNTHNNNENLARQQQLNNNSTSNNNNCDIIVVDIEDEQYVQQEQSIPTKQHFTIRQKYIIDANMKYRQHTTTYDVEKVVNKFNDNNNEIANDVNDDIDNAVDNEDNIIDDDDDDDSLASMETLSDNVSIWIDGEKHWVAGVDENTTCSDLIWALLNYRNGQQHHEDQQHQQHMYNIEDKQEIDRKTNNRVQQQQQPNEQHINIPKSEVTILYKDNKPKNPCSSDTININFQATTNFPTTITTNITATTTTSLNQSMPINTKENCKTFQNSSTGGSTAVASKKSTISSSSTPIPSSPPLAAPPPPQATRQPFTVTLPCGITTASQLTTEYVIVKQYHHCEEYLDGSTKVFDVVPPRNSQHKKECELLLRHLGPAPAEAAIAVMYKNNHAATPQLSSLISTDKDSGMGSPVGSARSAKFRRRKHKSSQWLAQANTLHPKLSRCTANERLMKIILAQDETIQRQLSLLREKERQITKIEEEKHRKRERELGKNYLLETYLNGLDEAECEPEKQDGEEIFIDEPYQRSKASVGVVTAGIPLEAVDIMTKHKFKEEEIKKEKKKKRLKDKTTKEEHRNITTTMATKLIDQCKDICSKTHKIKDKDRDRERDKEKPDRLHLCQENELKSGDIGNEQEIEMQILWLEKIYTLNKQLQREEELAAKLHAKVRKHQLRKAQQTQKEVQMEIDKLDNNLALQCGDIRKVEANLMETNEQFQKKLYTLERLSMEYLQQQQQHGVATRNEQQKNVDKLSPTPLDDNMKIIGNLEKSLDLQKPSLNNIKSTEEFNKIEKVIGKPNLEIKGIKCNSNFYKTATKYDTSKGNCTETINHNYTKQRTENENSIENLNPLSRQHINNTQDYHQHNHHNPQQVIAISTITTAPTTSSSITLPLTTTTTMSTTTNTTVTPLSSSPSPSCMFIDKNMLSSLQVQNAKTIKKQMFHTQTQTPTTITSSPVIVTAATIETSAFPKQQFQHFSQHMPTAAASKILTSRPQISHQIPTSSNIVVLKHPSAISSAIVTPVPIQIPASTSSPTPSLMAMNTVDISQLGTLV